MTTERTMRVRRLLFVILLAALVAAAGIASAHRRVVIAGPHESQLCDVSRLHFAASEFERTHGDAGRDELIRAVSDCMFITGESRLSVQENQR